MILYTDAIMQKSEGVKQGGLTLLRKNPMKSRFLERSFRARFNCFPIKNTFLKTSKKVPSRNFPSNPENNYLSACSALQCFNLYFVG